MYGTTQREKDWIKQRLQQKKNLSYKWLRMGEILSPIKNSEFAHLNGQFRHAAVCIGQFHAVKEQALSSVPIKKMAHTANLRQYYV